MAAVFRGDGVSYGDLVTLVWSKLYERGWVWVSQEY